MSAIYVLKWSTGAVKVGRSDDPERRIRQHKIAASGFGVQLHEQFVVECANSHYAERMLIQWAGANSVQAVGREWHVGLDYVAACDYALTVRDAVPQEKPTTVCELLRCLAAAGLSQCDIARLTGIPQPRISRWSAGIGTDSADDALKLLAMVEELEPTAQKPRHATPH